MRRVAVAATLLVLVLQVPMLPADSPGGLGVSPATIQFDDLAPGTVESVNLTVQNRFGEVTTVLFEAQGAIDRWAKIDPPGPLSLAAGEDRSVRIDVSVPPGVPNATYTGLLRVVAETGESSSGSGSRVRHAVSLVASIELDGPPVQRLEVTPRDTQMDADHVEPLRYEASVVDAEGRTVQLDPDQVRWALEPGEGGGFDADVVHPSRKAGIFAVHAFLPDTDPPVQGWARLRVTPGDYAEIEAHPAAPELAVGDLVRYTASTYDAHGNILPTPPLVWSLGEDGIGRIDDEGRFHALKPGRVQVTVQDEMRGLLDTVEANMTGARPELVDLAIEPPQLSLLAGESHVFEVVGIDARGNRTEGLTPTWSLTHDELGTLLPDGELRPRVAGRTQVVARMDGIEARADVTILPNRPVELRILPGSVVLPVGGEQRFTAVARDTLGNVVSDLPITWSLSGEANGSIRPDGTYQAGQTPATAKLHAETGILTAEATIFERKPVNAPAGTRTPLDTREANLTVGPWIGRAWSGGISTGDAGAVLELEGDGAPGQASGGLVGATTRLGAPAKNLSLLIEFQPGGLDLVPSEVDPRDLTLELQKSRSAPEPGVYISVRAVEDGATVEANRLNELVEDIDLNFTVPTGYFERHELDPERVRLIEYSNGKMVRANIPVEPADQEPGNGSFWYRTHLDQFSDFPFAADPLPGRGTCAGDLASIPLSALTPTVPGNETAEPSLDLLRIRGPESFVRGEDVLGSVLLENNLAHDVNVRVVVRLVDVANETAFLERTLDPLDVPGSSRAAVGFELRNLCPPPGRYAFEAALVHVDPNDSQVGNATDRVRVELREDVPGDGEEPAPSRGGGGGGGGWRGQGGGQGGEQAPGQPDGPQAPQTGVPSEQTPDPSTNDPSNADQPDEGTHHQREEPDRPKRLEPTELPRPTPSPGDPSLSAREAPSGSTFDPLRRPSVFEIDIQGIQDANGTRIVAVGPHGRELALGEETRSARWETGASESGWYRIELREGTARAEALADQQRVLVWQPLSGIAGLAGALLLACATMRFGPQASSSIEPRLRARIPGQIPAHVHSKLIWIPVAAVLAAGTALALTLGEVGASFPLHLGLGFSVALVVLGLLRAADRLLPSRAASSEAPGVHGAGLLAYALTAALLQVPVGTHRRYRGTALGAMQRIATIAALLLPLAILRAWFFEPAHAGLILVLGLLAAETLPLHGLPGRLVWANAPALGLTASICSLGLLGAYALALLPMGIAATAGAIGAGGLAWACRLQSAPDRTRPSNQQPP